MKPNPNPMTQLAPPLVIYVAGIDTRPTELVVKCHAAYGIFCGFPQFPRLNTGHRFFHNSMTSSGDHTAVYKGILETLFNVPVGQSYIIVSDVKWIMDQFSRATWRRRNGQKGWESMNEGPILDLIDFHTLGGDNFIELKYSGNDPSAYYGLEHARRLAQQALHPPKL